MGLEGHEQLIATLRAKANRLVKAVALEAHGRLIRKTPVDTGRARANWTIGVGNPDRTVDMAATTSDVQRAISEGRVRVLSEFEAGDVAYLTNGLAYVSELERGHSSQAPQGMIAVTAKELQPLVSRIAGQIGRGQDPTTGGTT